VQAIYSWARGMQQRFKGSRPKRKNRFRIYRKLRYAGEVASGGFPPRLPSAVPVAMQILVHEG
jgi:hypothetical protein